MYQYMNTLPLYSLVEYVYIAPMWVCRVLLMLRMWLRHTADVFFDWFVDYKLRAVAQEHRAVGVLNLIRGEQIIQNQHA